ncbi:MAG: thioredoxin reductase [Euryarchaeota archaeon]|jgi:thioredoxin reductase (NADPH)|nr:thioredoxin reductase [Euryarchaeota archaeon]HIK01282.1 FAD-dependent oxidoreductase [Candidatus Undinarchaeales archaeon ERR594346 U_76725]|tara:strand:- start:10867 stop:11772 length:906 start_codon:yes stop_codon:yes gene_type:complete
MHDCIVIGGGAAGLGASLYAARFKLDTILIAPDMGGTGNIAHRVDNWIGDPGISGIELMQKFIKHVKEYEVPLINESVKKIEKIEGGFKLTTNKAEYEGKAVIYATGMKHRKLGIPGEEEFQGKGVSYCYTCDAHFFKDKVVGIVGGGDSAGLGTLLLSEIAEKVFVLYRGERLKAEPITTEQVYALEEKNVKVIHNVNVTEIIGDKTLTGVKLDNGESMELGGLFIEIGAEPVVELVKDLNINLNERKFIEVDKQMATNLEGFYAAGDVTTHSNLKQFITSAAEGSTAAQSVYKYLKSKK